MSDSRAVDLHRLTELIDSVRQAITDECLRTAVERRAFESFTDRIRQLDPADPPVASNDRSSAASMGGSATASPPVFGVDAPDPTDDVRRAYEETVMAVPFYEAEYGDEYEESIRAELGPEVAIAVTQSQCFGPPATQALVRATQRAIAERTQLIETCTHEQESVDAAADVLLPLVSELDSIASKSVENEPFGALEARWLRLGTLRDRCNDVGVTRQRDINELRTRYDFPVDGPDHCVYLYQDLDAAYPILAGCASVAARLQTLQHRYERAMIDH